MKLSWLELSLLFCLSISRNQGAILRNNALMTKMVSNFHAPKAHAADIMRDILCKNFPSIPCKLITKDDALKKLVIKTVRLLNAKQRKLENLTLTTEMQTRPPVVNSDELAQYLAVENTGYFTEKHKHTKDRRLDKRKSGSTDVDNDGEQQHGRKNIKKYFPHKIKYSDKNDINSQEKLSVSEEMPAIDPKKLNSFKKQSNIMPGWQIDYTKHGDPSIPSFSQETDLLRGKLVKAGTDTENTVFKHRTGVLRPNVYIKNSAKRTQDY